jgi:hypothetical protein
MVKVLKNLLMVISIKVFIFKGNLVVMDSIIGKMVVILKVYLIMV